MPEGNDRFVVDASFLAEAIEHVNDPCYAKLFADETTVYAPRLIYCEIGNILLWEEKKGIIELKRISSVRSFLSTLRLHESDFLEIYDLAKRTGLTFYDASYLQSAIDLKLPLATYDKQLRTAAESCRIKLLPVHQ